MQLGQSRGKCFQEEPDDDQDQHLASGNWANATAFAPKPDRETRICKLNLTGRGLKLDRRMGIPLNLTTVVEVG